MLIRGKKEIEFDYTAHTVAEMPDICKQVKQNAHFVQKKGRAKIATSYYNIPVSFDTEASSWIDEAGNKRATMYAWMLGICGTVIMGRTHDELKMAFNILKTEFDTSYLKRLVIYVHNYSYDFVWMSHDLMWDISERTGAPDIFTVKERKVLYAISGGLEFRCSYLLSMKSLATIGNELTKYHIRKKVGDLDYDLIRHTGTPLTKKEVEYCIFDCLVLNAYISEKILKGENLADIPLTNTGYVRKDARKMCFAEGYTKYRHLMKTLTIQSVEELKMMEEAFCGGFTHASIQNVAKTHLHVYSMDFTSSYPTVMLAEKFPMGKGIKKIPKSFEEFKNLNKKYCTIFKIRFYGLRERIDWEHLLSESKCNLEGFYQVDNGRIIFAEQCETTLTNVDYLNIERFYTWDESEVSEMWCYKKAYLPLGLIKAVIKYYMGKTQLKGIEGKEEEYQLLKGMLNALYGMICQKVDRDMFEYDTTLSTGGLWMRAIQETATTLEHYNENEQRFTFWAWAVFVTAYARRNLFMGIANLGYDYIYADTDSVKFKNLERHQEFFDKYNEWIEARIQKCLKYYNLDIESYRPKNKKGKSKPMGVWDFDGCYTMFKTLGAKRYMTRSRNDYTGLQEVHITVAGLSKTEAVKYFTRNGNIAAFNEFRDDVTVPAEYTGKKTHTYIDVPTHGTVVDYLGNVGTYNEECSIFIGPQEYNLGVSEEYYRIFTTIQSFESIT